MNRNRFLISFSLIFVLFCLIFTNPAYAADTSALSFNSPSIILLERNTNNILYEKNSHEVRFPASTTKIMTAILTLENCKLTDVVRVSYNDVSNVPSGYSIANLKVDEELTIEQLLHLLLIPSASDAANTLAEHIAGSNESFGTMMTTKAIELGCKNTNFTNPDGRHDQNHVSTAYDLSLIANYAMNNQDFRTIVSKASYILYPTNKTSTERYFATTNSLLSKNSSNYYYDKAIGIKTGFTTPAGNCLVASAKDGDLEFISVVLGATQNANGLSERFLETKALFDFGFGNFTYKTVRNEKEVVCNTEVCNATKDTKKLNLELEKPIYAFIDKADLKTTFKPEISLKENIKAPILKGDVLGTATFTIENKIYKVNLLAANDVMKSYLPVILIVLFIIVVGVCVKVYLNLRHKKNMKRTHRIKKNN